jgi:hypothetical protein
MLEVFQDEMIDSGMIPAEVNEPLPAEDPEASIDLRSETHGGELLETLKDFYGINDSDIDSALSQDPPDYRSLAEKMYDTGQFPDGTEDELIDLMTSLLEMTFQEVQT